MPKASVKRLIDNRKDKLIEFVLDIEKYPEFIPFCDNSKVYERSDKGDTINIIADLTIGKGPFKDTFKSDVKLNKKNDHIHVVNLGGPLNHLENNENHHIINKKKIVPSNRVSFNKISSFMINWSNKFVVIALLTISAIALSKQAWA